jgi:Na+-transporting NADH:ubiquinone oxidoreductase subunit NqrC
MLNKELILLISLFSIIAFSVIYWIWFSNNEYKKLIDKIRNMPMVAAIIAIFWENDSDSNNGAQ